METNMQVFNPSQMLVERDPSAKAMRDFYHTYDLLPGQCASGVVQAIDAPLRLVWSLVRQFDNPQVYKRIVWDCTPLQGTGEVRSVREVSIVSALPADVSLERLDRLDDDLHVMCFSVIGRDQRLATYCSTLKLHEDKDDGVRKTAVMESYVADVPEGNIKEETCLFVNTIIGFNLETLAAVAETMPPKPEILSKY